MAYDQSTFRKLHSAGVDVDGALILAQLKTDLDGKKAAAVADIPTPGSATAATCANKVNELLAALRAAGLLAP